MAGYAESIQTVFLVAVPIAFVAFLATWLIPQVELKRWPQAAPAAPEAEMPLTGATVTPAALTAAPEALTAEAAQSAPGADAGVRARE